MQTSVTRSKLALNTILLLLLTSSLFLTGCNTTVSDQPTSFCELVDPNSKYYSPNSLSIEQLNTCRIQAEKILAIQSMQIQIHRQRDEVITAANIQSPSGPEINKALNSLSAENSSQNSNVSATNTNLASNNQRKTASQSQASRKIAANQSATRVIAQPTQRSTSNESVQQRYLNDASTTPARSNNTQNTASNTRATPSSQYNAEQAARVAKQIDSLLQSEATQAVLNQPKALLPGEETTKLNVIDQINARNTTKAETTNKTTTIEPKAVSLPQAESKEKALSESITNQAKPVTNQANTTQLNPPTQNTGKLSTDYTSTPSASNPEPSNTTNNTNPVAQIVKPADATNMNPVNSTQNKTQIDNYDPTPLPALSEPAGNQPPIKNTESQPDPLAHLQQIRTENK